MRRILAGALLLWAANTVPAWAAGPVGPIGPGTPPASGGGGTTYTGTAPVVVNGTVISAPTAQLQSAPVNLGSTFGSSITDTTQGLQMNGLATAGISQTSGSMNFIEPSGNGFAFNINGATRFQVDQFGNTNVKSHLLSTVSEGLTATGTTQGTGTSPSTDDVTYTTVASGASITLVNVGVGAQTTIRNRGLNPLTVFPWVGAKIESGAVNASVSIAVGNDATLKETTSTQLRQ